jgi:hypothetical protein
MKRTALALVVSLAVMPFTAMAHKAWLQPSETVLAGTDPWVTVDAAVSNDLFYFNHVPLPLERLVITAPDGSKVDAQNGATGKYRSVFDVQLKQQGTYRIAMVNSGLSASCLISRFSSSTSAGVPTLRAKQMTPPTPREMRQRRSSSTALPWKPTVNRPAA